MRRHQSFRHMVRGIEGLICAQITAARVFLIAMMQKAVKWPSFGPVHRKASTDDSEVHRTLQAFFNLTSSFLIAIWVHPSVYADKRYRIVSITCWAQRLDEDIMPEGPPELLCPTCPTRVISLPSDGIASSGTVSTNINQTSEEFFQFGPLWTR